MVAGGREGEKTVRMVVVMVYLAVGVMVGVMVGVVVILVMVEEITPSMCFARKGSTPLMSTMISDRETRCD